MVVKDPCRVGSGHARFQLQARSSQFQGLLRGGGLLSNVIGHTQKYPFASVMAGLLQVFQRAVRQSFESNHANNSAERNRLIPFLTPIARMAKAALPQKEHRPSQLNL